ncbi:MAG: UMP kinase, partial [Planctomycetota bacterium]
MSVPGDRRRVLLKISGEALCEGGGAGLAPDAVLRVAREIEPGVAAGVGIAVVVGGGNFVRGSELDGAWIPRLTADSIGMLATVMNALALRCALEEIGLQARVFSAIPALPEVDPFEAWRCRQHLDGGGVAVLAGGTG